MQTARRLQWFRYIGMLQGGPYIPFSRSARCRRCGLTLSEAVLLASEVSVPHWATVGCRVPRIALGKRKVDESRLKRDTSLLMKNLPKSRCAFCVRLLRSAAKSGVKVWMRFILRVDLALTLIPVYTTCKKVSECATFHILSYLHE